MRTPTLLAPWFVSVCLALISLRVSTPGGEASAPATPHFERWEKEIAAFESLDRTNPPAPGAVLFTGSSTIRLWKTLAEDFPGHRVLNRGFGGSQIVDCTHFADRIIFPYQPHTIVLRSGGNDLNAGKSPEQVFSDFKEFVATVRAKLPETRIVYISLNPTRARIQQTESSQAVNQLIQDYIRSTPGLHYVDIFSMALGPEGLPRLEYFAPDKLHFNAAGYQLLAERVRPFLIQSSGR